jgi:hypothetical protein
MACDLTLGRLVPCKDVVGGINRIYFVNYGALGTLTIDSDDELTAISETGVSAFEYVVKGANSLEQTINSSRENGTTFFTQTLSITLTKMTKEDNKQLKLMAYGRPHIFVQDRNGNTFLCGANYGCEVTGGTAVTGAEMGDLNGYTLTFEATEQLMALFVSGAATADPFGDVTGITPVVGTNS